MGVIDAILRIKRATKSWLWNEILKNGEIAYETDENGLKIGDGTTPYSNLKYIFPSTLNNKYKYLKLDRNDNPKWAAKGEDGYLSINRLSSYIYAITFINIPDYEEISSVETYACTSFVKDNKLYRNLDWSYDNTNEFIVFCKGFKGMSMISGITDSNMDERLLNQLPYHINDGVNEDGIMVSSHILYDDFNYHYNGNINITKLPFIILSELHDINDIHTVLDSILQDIKIPEGLSSVEYLMQYMVTDGIITYIITPTDNGYEIVDASSNPKMTNFKWIDRNSVNRTDSDMQLRPTGIERFNLIDFNSTTLEDLKFTECYENDNRLSEFIGINGTDKYSTDSELEDIYTIAHGKYQTRTRNGELWQTIHSIIYSKNGIELLYVQENYNNVIIRNEKYSGGDINIIETVKVNGIALVPDIQKAVDVIVPTKTSELTNDSDFIESSSLASVAISGEYSDLINKPIIPTDTSDLTNSAGYITLSDVPAQVQSDWDEADNNNPAYIKNKPTIPTDTSDLTNGAGYITSADIPSIPNGAYINIAASGWGPNAIISAYLRTVYFYNGEVPSKVGDYVYSKSTRCLHKITFITQIGGETVANADFIAFFSGFDSNYNSLSGKPTLGTAAALNVPASGDAATTEVVKGDDTRLTDARTPTSHTHTASDITNLSGTNDGTNWTTITIGSDTYAIPSGGGGLTNYNFTFSTLVNNTVTYTFAADQRCYQRVTMTAGATINFQINNSSDNYVRFYNSSASDITLAIGSVTYNGSSVPTTIIPDDTVSVKAGKYVEIGVLANSIECDITISSGLKIK